VIEAQRASILVPRDHLHVNQIRTVILWALLHKNTIGLLALGHYQGAQAANYANVSVDNRTRTRRYARWSRLAGWPLNTFLGE
jgi:hypothetical protein